MPNSDTSKNTVASLGGILKKLSTYNPFLILTRSTKVKALFALGMVCFFWGTTWVASKQGVKYMPALQMAGIRQLLGGLCYVVFFMIKGAKFPKGKEWIPIIVLSILNFALSNGLATWGLKYISGGLGAIIGAIFPLWLVVIGVFLPTSKLPSKAVAGLLVGFGGVCIIFYDHLQDFFNGDFRFGILISLVATWTWAFGTVYTKKQAVNFNPYFSLGLQMVISGILLSSIAHLTNDTVSIIAIPWQSWMAIAYLVIFGSVISFIAYLYALQNLPAEQASLYAYINPIVAVLLGLMLFGERLTVFIAVGGAVALSGIYIVNKAYKTADSGQPEGESV